jgi:hypothetical protein
MCYRDMTFCRSHGCINTDCERHESHVPKETYFFNTDGLPVAWANFEDDCPIIIREKEE